MKAIDQSMVENAISGRFAQWLNSTYNCDYNVSPHDVQDSLIDTFLKSTSVSCPDIKLQLADAEPAKEFHKERASDNSRGGVIRHYDFRAGINNLPKIIKKKEDNPHYDKNTKRETILLLHGWLCDDHFKDHLPREFYDAHQKSEFKGIYYVPVSQDNIVLTIKPCFGENDRTDLAHTNH